LPVTHVWPGLHEVPHAPQFALDVCKSAHVPAQSVVPGAQAHALFTHTRVPEQICPQNPQFLGSLVRSTHELPHCASPEPHAAEHIPALHTSERRQRFPHDPQSVDADWRFTQTELPPMPMHSVSAAGHMQAPPMQGAPIGHWLPQPPQLPLEVCVLTQVIPPMPPGQSVRPVEQPMTQLPAVHIVPPGHRLPHPPQFRGSVCVLVQFTPHMVSPPPQLHVPLAQFAPAGQVIEQPPQFDGSVCTSTHALLQSVSPEAHVVVHTPLEQTCMLVQALPQPPQLLGSPCVSVHTPRQRVPPL
jgi:hypothetical protein